MKKILILLMVIALCPIACGAQAKKHIIDWGLKHNTKEMSPEPPDGANTMLAEGNGIYVANTQDKKVYFTFDLGYEAGYTDEVLNILKENNIKSTFFLCGNYLKNDSLVNRMIEEGHSIGNHTNLHKDLPTLSEETAKKDIVDFAEKYKEKYSAPLNYFRPPKGRICEQTLRLAKEQGYKTLMWSIAIADWGKQPIDAEGCSNKISSRIHPGAIVLFHITNSGTPKMLKSLIPKLLAKGYTVANSNEL